MHQIIASVVLLATLTVVLAGKCDIMKEFKPDVDDIVGWAKAKCDASPELSDADLKKAQDCYNKNLKPCFTSDNGKAVDTFVTKKIFESADTKKVCTDKKVQDNIKKCAMKDIGMKKGMECKKEIEADCPKYKSALQAYNKCVKG